MEKVYILDRETNTTYYLIGVKSISPTQSVTVTEYPVPEGSFISDHAYKTSDSLTLKVMFDALDNTHQSYFVNNDGTSSALTYDIFKEVLQRWIAQATQLDIQTVHHLFRSFVLDSLSWNEGDKRNRFEPTLSFREIRIGYLYTLPISSLGVKYIASYTTEEDTKGKDNGTEFNNDFLSNDVDPNSVGGQVANVTKYLDVRYWITKIPGVENSWFGQQVKNTYSASAKIINAVTGFFGKIFGG